MRLESTKWTESEVCEYFDFNWNITLADLSDMSGHSVKQLKRILMGGSK